MSLPYLHPYLGLSNGLNTLHAAGAGGAVGGWVELGRTTLGGTADTITVSSLDDKRYYMVLSSIINSGNVTVKQRWNNDSGSNYAYRYSDDGGTDFTGTSQTQNFWYKALGNPSFTVDYTANLAGNEKLNIREVVQQNTAGAGTAPSRRQGVEKWVNTSNAINRIDLINDSTGDYASGSECVVLGWDTADSHTNNFWEELASVNAGASSTSIDTSTFTAKKYLWIQAFIKSTGSSMGSISANFNNDTGTNYANRYSDNGGADGTITSNIALILVDGGNLATNESALINFFIVNNSSNEKLVIGHAVKRNTAGAANAPTRRETAQKWTNTSSQITSFKIVRDSGSGTFDTNSIIKVWGAN
jgi:hypothetical protein